MKIHFIGDNGVSMRALKALARSNGNAVSGSDAATTGHSEKNVRGKDLVVYTNAVPDDNCELKAARALGIPTVERAAYLGSVSRNYGAVIAIAGCHGKSTATAMLGAALKSVRPTVHVGVNGGSVIGKRKLFITEACEYKGSFLHLSPDIGVVLNIDRDHPDCYRDMAEIGQAYRAFCSACRTVLVNGDDKNCRNISRAVTFGLSPACDYRAENITERGGMRSFVFRHGDTALSVNLNVPGAHNVKNALAALSAAHLYGADMDSAVKYIQKFRGIARRFEYMGTAYGKAVYCDYAHHPEEITATVLTARELYPSVAVVFQPHTYSRTEAFLDGFASSLSLADTVALAPIFPAREKPTGVTSRDIQKRLKSRGHTAYCFDSFSDINTFCKMLEEKAIIFMGAGDIDRACAEFVGDMA